MPTVKRSTPMLTSKLGGILLRRKGGRPVGPASIGTLAKDGTIAKMHKDATPLSAILSKSKTHGRPPRDSDYIHVSDLIGRCIRKIALVESLGMTAKPQSLSITDALTFAQGDAIHDVIKHRASSGAPEQVWGLWRCRCGNSGTREPCLLSEVDNEALCSICQTPMDTYVETVMRDKEHKIVGSPDLITFDAGLSALHVNELKSIAHDRWKELLRPIPELVLQTVFYWHLIHKQGYRVTDKVSILYVTKGWMFSGDPYKEFTLNPEEHLHRLTPMYEDAMAIKLARKGGKLPVRTCPTPTAPDAKKCEVCNACFGANSEVPVTISIAKAFSRSKA